MSGWTFTDRRADNEGKMDEREKSELHGDREEHEAPIWSLASWLISSRNRESEAREGNWQKARVALVIR